jgi:hypothetical protein
MSTNHQLKNCLFDFLSNRTFSGYEFKDLRTLFISQYPEFSAKKYYAKIYQIIRELASINLILIDSRSCTYKYSSNYEHIDILDLIAVNEFNSNIKTDLALESDRVINEIKKITNELSIYQRYLQRFPTLSEIVQNLVKIKEKEIGLLKCELTAIKNMIEAC